jgi:hypothetical protein
MAVESARARQNAGQTGAWCKPLLAWSPRRAFHERLVCLSAAVGRVPI